MQEKKFKIVQAKKTRYILPNILTLVGVCLGISSIKFSLDLNFKMAVIFIILAAILDALDGRIARLIKGTTDFGKELDSLTDFVSFGIAPAFIIYFWELNNYGKLGWAVTLIYSVCCVLRLARFNLTKYGDNESWKQNYFEGVPSPIGALLMNKKVASAMTPGSHGSTFGGNPLAMSVGNAVLDQIFKKGFLKNVEKMSEYFLYELKKIQEDYPEIIKEVRGIGLLIGLQLHNDQTKFIKKLENNKLLTIRAGENVVRILPPLNVKKQELDLALKIIRNVCDNFI